MRFLKTLLGAIVLLLASSNLTSAAIIAYSPSDTGDPRVFIRDLTNGATIEWRPDGAAVSDVAIDAATGFVYASTERDVYRRNANGTTTSLGIFGAGINRGADIAINGSVLTWHWDDLGYREVYIRDLTGGPTITWAPDGVVNDVAIDAATGLVYASTEREVYRRNANGTTTSLGIFGAGINYGADIAINGNVLAYHYADFNGDPNVFIQDLTGGPTIPWRPDGAVSDIAFDPVTGELYAYANGGVYKRLADGSTVLVPGIDGAGTNSGADIAIYSQAAVPEPSAYITLSGLILCFGLAGWWRKRKQAA